MDMEGKRLPSRWVTKAGLGLRPGDEMMKKVKKVKKVEPKVEPKAEPKKRRVSSPEAKVLKELKAMNNTLSEIRLILDNIWRERKP